MSVLHKGLKPVLENVYADNVCIGSSLYGGAVAESGQVERVAMRAGVFDDLKDKQECKPSLEIYTKERLEWLKPVEGCMQFEGMPSF